MRVTALVSVLTIVLTGCGSSDGRSAAPRQSSAAPVATPVAETTDEKAGSKNESSRGSGILKLPIEITTQGGEKYSTSNFAVEIHFTAPDHMAYPFLADADLETFVSMGSDDSGGVVFLAPKKVYTSTGKLEKTSALLAALKANSRISLTDESSVRVGGIRATKATVVPRSIPHAKWALCGDTYCVPIILIPNDSPYGLVKGIRYTYYFLEVNGRSIIISIEGEQGNGYRSFFNNALKLVNSIEFASK